MSIHRDRSASGGFGIVLLVFCLGAGCSSNSTGPDPNPDSVSDAAVRQAPDTHAALDVTSTPGDVEPALRDHTGQAATDTSDTSTETSEDTTDPAMNPDSTEPSADI